MKILHKSKRAAPPPPQVTELITKLVQTPDDELPEVLGKIAVWIWPRSDLNAWIKVLNKFDAILERLIITYDVDKLQVNSFSPEDKKTLLEILRFERLLLENSTNRKMYNSYDRINSLLFTEDLDILTSTLKLLLRPSQQYSAQPSVSQALHISTPRLQSLARRWPYLREYGVDLVHVASIMGTSEIDALPTEAREVHFTFYRTEGRPSEQAMDTDAPTSPRKPSAPTRGAVVIHIDEKTLNTKRAIDILADAIETYSLPDSEKFELLCRIRTAQSLRKSTGEQQDTEILQVERERLVSIRLLAIAIFGHTHPESQATSALFLYEPDLIVHVAELLQVDRGVPLGVQTVALAALDALARYRGKLQEVLTSVNAGVNHGILMALLRKTIAHVAQPDSNMPHSFVEALLAFVTFVAANVSGGNMIVGAGLIPLLIQLIDNKVPARLPIVSKAMQLVDNVLYSFTNAFQLFTSSRGMETLVERISYEVELDITEHGDVNKSREIYGSHGEIPVARAAVLKHILRSLHRMMQNSGTAEGLRGLIDSSILKSIKRIIEFRGLFGPSVLPIAINIMATFVHNEPSSLSVIQEAGLPESFYKSIEVGLEPSIEVIQAIPNAIGALCLNDVGQAQLSGRPSIIPAIFSIFTSDRHLKVLLDKENAVLIGTSIDELIRHHPSLKVPVFEAIKATLSKIEDLGNAYVPADNLKHWYGLVPVPASVSPDADVTMEDVGAANVSSSTPTVEATPAVEENAPRAHDNHIVSFIDILGRFLEGLFQHPPHCRDFITSTDALARIGRLTALPCLPYDFANSVASDSMVQVMRTMTEVATSETLVHLAKLVEDSLNLTKGMWVDFNEKSRLAEYVDLSADQEVSANELFRNLVTLHIRLTLLSDVFATAGYAHGRAAIHLLQTLMSKMSPQVIADLGSLHRATMWENLTLKAALTDKGIEVAQTPAASPLAGSPDQPTVPLPDTEGATIPSANAAPNGDGAISSEGPTAPSPSKENSKPLGPREHNAAALKHWTHNLPGSLSPFFTAMVKMFHGRRSTDAAQKKQITESSAVVARIMLQHLNQKDLHDKTSAFTYYGLMLGLINVLLVDDRTSSTTLHSVQVLALYRVGGFDAVFDVCRQFMASIQTIADIREESRSPEQSQELLHAYGGLKIALHLLSTVISKALIDSAQTALLATRDKEETDPQYFEPHNFLVKLRLAILPLLRDLWDAPWLLQAPLTVSRSVVQTVLELSNGLNEEPKGDAEAMVGGIAGLGSVRPTVDEGRIRQLTDMGFPRSAAERALMRTMNNVNQATELLLAHPYPFPPDPEPEPQADAAAGPETADAEVPGTPDEAIPTEAAPVPTEEAVPADSTTAAVEPSAEVATVTPEPAPAAETSEPRGKTAEEWRKELNEAREPLRAGISRRALLLVDEHHSLLFDVHGAFIRPVGPHQQKAVQDLVEDIKTFSPFAYDVQEQPLAHRCRLLALVLCEAPSSLSPELRATLIDSLLALLLSNPVSIQPDQPATPRWLAAHLLVTEALFTLADEPRQITLPKENEPIVAEALVCGPALTEARTIVFDFCLRLLAIPDLPNDEVLSALRLFVLLTRDSATAAQFVKRDGITMLFKRLHASPVNGSSSYVATILRHIVEDKATIQHIMRQAIKRYFTNPRTRIIEMSSFVRNCSAMALRDSQSFIEVTQTLCQLGSPFGSQLQVTLKAEVSAEKAPAKADDPDVTAMEVDVPAESPPRSNESLDGVVHFLIGELLQVGKEIMETPTGSTTESSDAPTTVDPAKVKDQCQYACFLMQCLTELLFSYDSCKVAFLSFSPKKKPQTPGKDGPSKHRTAALNFLLGDLISYGTISPQSNSENRDKISVCNWAMSVLVALCVDSSSTHDVKEVSPDLVGVRKFVLEAISKAIKDLPPSDVVEERYGRLLALVDLCHRLLTVRFNTTSRKQQDEVPTHIAKVMLEKGFVATLTTALSEVDLNYPNIRGLVASILRPLEYLTKIAIKMSRLSNKVKDGADEAKVREDSESLISDEDEEDEPEDSAVREETPDLYRNSALGMYAGEMEDVNNYNAEDDEMDDVDEGSDDDEEMDFADQTGSDDTSNTEDEEDEEELEDGPPGNPDVAWHHPDDDEEDDDEEDDLVQNEDDEGPEDVDDEGDEDDNDEQDGEELQAEMMWQDMHGGDGDGGDGEEGDEEEEGVHVLHEAEEDEPEMVSDEEEYGHDLDMPDGGGDIVRDIFGFGRDPRHMFTRRHHRGPADDNVQVFGRTRNAPAAPPESTTHPLLLDASAPTRGAGSRNSRQSRILAAGGNSELLQTIEELVSNGAVQLFQHIMTRSRGGGGPETIRVDVPAGALMTLERGLRRPGALQAVRAERPRPNQSQNQPQGRDLDPLLTLQRWAEEVKILHGDFVGERVGKLVNHVSLALLPTAIEIAKAQKEEEARRQAEEAKAEEEAALAAAEKAKVEEAARLAAEEAARVAAEEAAAVAALAAEAAAAMAAQEVVPAPTEESEQPAGADHVMEDATAVEDGDAVMVDATVEPVSAPANVEETVAESSAEPSSSTAESSAPPTRVTITIHGSEVDITDTGIDPTFLEALPDDMREEVLSQHFRDQRAAQVARPADSQISSEFLDALPPEIRAEIIHQESLERRRNAAPTTGPAEIDNASFIASLDPGLRQAVLLDQEDGFLQSLPSDILAEVGAFREQAGRMSTGRMSTGTARRGPIPAAATPRKPAVHHDAIQLLDKTGVAVLIRLLFFPQVLKKTLLFRVLLNICENSRTRTELFNLLLNILQDGTGDLASVDKSFSQMTVKNSKPSAKALGKQKASDLMNALALPNTQGEAIPDLIAQRCLESLIYIVTTNPTSSMFFLTEHELPAGLRRVVSKKGKGKEKQAPQSHYPIVLLLGLLDRQSLLRTPSIMESVVSLLATVTRPLMTIKDSKKQPEVPAEAPVEVAEGSVPAATSPPTTSDAPASESANPVVPAVTPSTSAPSAAASVPAESSKDAAEQNTLITNPPQIPHSVLRLIVNILTVGECSGRTFQQSLALIQNLSNIPDARDVIAQELKVKAQEFGQSLFSDLDELAVALQASDDDVLVGPLASKFSSSSSIQAKLLRVLKTIDYMYTPKNVAATPDGEEDSEKVQSIYESFRFAPLWKRLGDCLAIIEEKPSTEHVATVLLPLIEALMVVCKYVGPKSAAAALARTLRATSSPKSPTTARESMEDLFVTFTDAHRKILNLMVRNNPSLMSGSFSLLVHNPRVLDFDNKRNYFTQQLHRRPHLREHHGSLGLNLRRARVFEDSFQQLQRKTGEQIKYGKLSIRFFDEEGVDAGGLTREWFQILARQMFDPNNALFQPCAADKLTYQPNKNSWVNPEHLSFFKFVGRVIGKAIYDGRLLDAYFARSLYRQLLGKPVDYKDVEWVDPEYYNSLCWILENDPTLLELTFSVEADEFGVNRIVPLKEGGETLAVTQENKREFVQLSAQYRLYSSIKDQIEHLSNGFYEIIPKDLITIFNEQELELLISGTPDIDVDEWRAATEYNGYSSSDPNIVWWWRALKSFTRDERAKVLSFATGTSRVPLSGFVDLQGVQGTQRFSIHKAYGESDRLPQAHTCFNQIDLPQYTSYDMLRQQLLLAINEGGEGFGFV
ncbi:hypothetical protein C8J56DRAFT_339945 [Mycena floridula]|nr:hypothetical protein C8J56DRAFT_339945 [Mycena floridula]